MALLTKDNFSSIDDEIDYLKHELKEVKAEIKLYMSIKNPTKKELKDSQVSADKEFNINNRLNDAYKRKRRSMIQNHSNKSLNFAPYTYDGKVYGRNISNGFCINGISL